MQAIVSLKFPPHRPQAVVVRVSSTFLLKIGVNNDTKKQQTNVFVCRHPESVIQIVVYHGLVY